MALIERDQIPAIGMATTRRALRTLTTTYNDNSIQSLVCFVCAGIFCTFAGPTGVDFSKKNEAEIPARSEIEYRSVDFFRIAERLQPGTLLNNCSLELWEKRYVAGHYEATLLEAGKNGLREISWIAESRLSGEVFIGMERARASEEADLRKLCCWTLLGSYDFIIRRHGRHCMQKCRDERTSRVRVDTSTALLQSVM